MINIVKMTSDSARNLNENEILSRFPSTTLPNGDECDWLILKGNHFAVNARSAGKILLQKWWTTFYQSNKVALDSILKTCNHSATAVMIVKDRKNQWR